MRWFSNLRIGNKLFLVFSVEMFFWVAICSVFFIYFLRIKGALVAAGPQFASAMDGEMASFIAVALVISLVFVLTAVFMTALAIRTIAVPIDRLADSAVQISQGVIDMTLSSNRKDEIGRLARELDGVLLVLQSLNDDLNNFSDEHNIAGNVYAKIRSEKYEGAYKETVEKLNAMLWQYIADGRDVLYCISEFTQGSFNTQVRTFPGMRSIMNNISYGLRQELVTLSGDIKNAAAAAADGNFEKRIDEKRYKGEWKEVAKEINRLLDEVAKSINETTDALLEVFEGNLNPELKGDFTGDFMLVKTSLSNAVESVSGCIGEISSVLSEISDKNLAVGLKGDFSGDYGVLRSSVEHVITTMGEILVQTESASKIIEQSADKLSGLADGAPEIYDRTDESENSKIENIFGIADEIADQFDKLTKVVDLVEDISYQTNLVALNVSVEAARAGEQSKGISLVAGEVKYLAEMCGEAANVASELIGESKTEVASKTEKIRLATAEFKEITGQRGKLAELLNCVSEVRTELAERSLALTTTVESFRRQTIN